MLIAYILAGFKRRLLCFPKQEQGALTAPFRFMAAVDPFQVFDLVDVGKRGEFVVNGPDLFDRYVAGV